MPITPGWTESLAAPPPPPSISNQALPARPLRLRPVWVGFVIVLLQFIVTVVAVSALGVKQAVGLVFLFNLPALIYYFVIIHRMIRVLEMQPGWSAEYTPAGVVWKQFIPFYGIFFLYQWTGDIERYISWRRGRSTKAGLLTFLVLFTGFLLRLYDSSIGFFVIFAALYVLTVPLRKALSIAPPSDEPAPAYTGSLGLR